MKSPSNSRPKGVALVIVLSFLVLISMMIVGFFVSVSTQRASTAATANSALTHQLADSSVNVVMAQIVDATKGRDSNNATLAWASQPGMIRTFDYNGTPRDFFKLYSSDKLTASGQTFDASAETPPGDWSKADNAGLYTDLNEPVLVADPSGLIQPDPASPAKYTAVYPIMNPFAEGIVDGFRLTSRPGHPNTKLPSPNYNPTRLTVADSTPNPAPMPVKWMYLLKDGSLKPASSPYRGNVTVLEASITNPIVGPHCVLDRRRDGQSKHQHCIGRHVLGCPAILDQTGFW